MPRKRKHASQRDEPPLAPATTALLAWLSKCGTEGLDQLSVRPTADGLGVFANRAFAPGDRIASLPQRCVLSARGAEESELGRAMRTAASAMGPTCEVLCTEEVVLWTYMAVGRVDASHPWHAYLASLPATSPEPASWPQELRDALAATPVGASVGAAREAVQAAFDGLVGRLRQRLPELVPEGALDDVGALLWARGVFRSRAFPAQLLAEEAAEHGVPLAAEHLRAEADDAEADSGGSGAQTVGGTAETWGAAAGVLLPLFDLLNHRPGTRIGWVATAARVDFVTPQVTDSAGPTVSSHRRLA